MKIAPISNRNNSKNKNINFGQIYPIKVNKNYFVQPDDIDHVYEFFNKTVDASFKAIREMYRVENGIVKTLMDWRKIKNETKFSLFLETQKFVGFKKIQKLKNTAPWWVTSRLGIDEPKLLSGDNHYTFFLYTGDDYKKIDKLLSKKQVQEIEAQNYAIIEEKCAKGEYKEKDIPYWNVLLLAEKNDERFSKLMENNLSADIELESYGESIFLLEKLSETIRI